MHNYILYICIQQNKPLRDLENVTLNYKACLVQASTQKDHELVSLIFLFMVLGREV